MDEPTTAPLNTEQVLQQAADAANNLYFSNMMLNGRRLSWKELAEHQHEEIVRLQRFASMVYDLDRNEHGRHEGDSDVEDPTGVSQGNPHIPVGYVFGYTVHGTHVYALPPREQRHDPDAYIFKKPQATGKDDNDGTQA